MDGQRVFKTAIATIVPAINEALDEMKLHTDDISFLVCHQANNRIIQNIAKTLNIPKERHITNIANYANTSAASIPLALSEHHQKTPFKKGDIILCAGFGAGFTWGVSIIKWE